VVIDRLFFGEWVFTPLNFLKFNLLQNVSIFYGTHPWHWYLTQGIPVVFFTSTPLVVFGVLRARRYDLCLLMVWTVFVYSCLAHKEFRFLFPLLPLANIYSGCYLFSLVRVVPFKAVRLFGARRSHHRVVLSSGSQGKKQALLVLMLIITNIPFAFYASTFHQRGVIDVMYHLRREGLEGRLDSVHLLMPCHSTPLQSHLHLNVPVSYITCEPPLRCVPPLPLLSLSLSQYCLLNSLEEKTQGNTRTNLTSSSRTP